MKSTTHISVGTRALILSKLYYGVLTKTLEHLDVDRYFAILYYIHEHKGCCQQKICNELMVDKAAMVKVLDHLSDVGFIEKSVNPNDRREHFISLSKKGEKQTKEIIKTMESIDLHMFKDVPAADRETFISVLHTATHNLQQMPSNNLFFNYKSVKKTQSSKK